MKNAIIEWRSENKIPAVQFVKLRVLGTSHMQPSDVEFCTQTNLMQDIVTDGRQFLLSVNKMNLQLTYITLQQLVPRVTGLM